MIPVDSCSNEYPCTKYAYIHKITESAKIYVQEKK